MNHYKNNLFLKLRIDTFFITHSNEKNQLKTIKTTWIWDERTGDVKIDF